MIRAAALTTLALLAAPAAAHASEGTTTIAVGGPAATSLRAQGVRTIAIPPARATGTTWTLPISAGGPTARHLGGFILQARRGGITRRLVLTSLQLRTTSPRPAFTTLVAGRRITLLHLGSSQLGTASLSPAAAAVISRRLHLRSTPRGRLGTLTTRSAAAAPAPPAPPSPAGPAASPEPPAAGVPAAPRPIDTARDCPAAGAPASEPAAPARPQAAVDVRAATITWHVRDSFTDYINTGEGTSVADGAAAAPASGSPPLPREFSFPFHDGWFDAGTGAAALRFSGCVRFAYAGHGIHIDAQEPEILLAATGSRAVFRFSGSSTTPGRAVLADLALGPPALGEDGRTRTWSELAATIPAGAASSVFAGFYFPGDPFGWFTVSLTT